MEGTDVEVVLGGVRWGVVMVPLTKRAVWGHRGTLCALNCLLDETQPLGMTKKSIKPTNSASSSDSQAGKVASLCPPPPQFTLQMVFANSCRNPRH